MRVVLAASRGRLPATVTKRSQLAGPGYLLRDLFNQDRGRHRRKRALVRSHSIRVALHESEHIGSAWLGGKVVHFVIEQESRAFHRDAASVPAVKCVGI